MKKDWSIGMVLLVLSWAWGATAQVRPTTPVPTKAIAAPRSTIPARQIPSNQITPTQNKIVIPSKKPVTAVANKKPQKKIKPMTIDDEILSSWKLIENPILEYSVRLGVLREGEFWGPSPKAEYPSQLIFEEKKTFLGRNNNPSESQKTTFANQIQSRYQVSIQDLDLNKIYSWQKACSLKPLNLSEVPPEIRNNKIFYELGLDQVYVFEDFHTRAFSLLNVKKDGVSMRSFTPVGMAVEGKKVRFSSPKPFSDFNYYLKKVLEKQACPLKSIPSPLMMTPASSTPSSSLKRK